jgi:hypothetical protein
MGRENWGGRVRCCLVGYGGWLGGLRRGWSRGWKKVIHCKRDTHLMMVCLFLYVTHTLHRIVLVYLF